MEWVRWQQMEKKEEESGQSALSQFGFELDQHMIRLENRAHTLFSYLRRPALTEMYVVPEKSPQIK